MELWKSEDEFGVPLQIVIHVKKFKKKTNMQAKSCDTNVYLLKVPTPPY